MEGHLLYVVHCDHDAIAFSDPMHAIGTLRINSAGGRHKVWLEIVRWSDRDLRRLDQEP